MGLATTEDFKEYGTDAFKERSKDSGKDFSSDSKENGWQCDEIAKELNPGNIEKNDELPNQDYFNIRSWQKPGDIFSF